MTTSIEQNEELQAALEHLYSEVASKDLQPLWTQVRELMTRYPKPAAIPWLWQWKTLLALAERAGELVSVERGGERRVLALSNPGLNGLPFATSTLWAGIQYLNPGEVAPAHRHSPGAIRFVLQGEGMWTTVNGDACDMQRGDLVLTPGGTWHDHTNPGSEPVIWFDGLDLPTIQALDAVFFETFPDLNQQPNPLHNLSELTFGGRGTLPVEVATSTTHSPLLVYRWEDTDTALSALLKVQGTPIASLKFVNPATGQSVMPTFGCEIHRIIKGGHTRPGRKVGSSVFVIFQGSGYSVINEQKFDWSAGDMFVTPSWATYEHVAFEQSDLFTITDRPLLETLGLFRQEEEQEPQPIKSQFQAK